MLPFPILAHLKQRQQLPFSPPHVPVAPSPVPLDRDSTRPGSNHMQILTIQKSQLGDIQRLHKLDMTEV